MAEKKTRCVIFDCEGTLVDSERLCCEALVRIFNDLGADLSVDDVAQHFSGGKIADILNTTLELVGMSADLDVLETRYRQELEMLFSSQLKPMRGVIRLLETLGRNHIEFCVASNAPRKKMESVLQRAGLMHYFSGKVFSAFEANSWKPEPDLIRYCAMNMGFALDECIYVDDTAKGVEAGVQAGVDTFQVNPVNPSNRTTYDDVVILNTVEQLIDYVC